MNRSGSPCSQSLLPEAPTQNAYRTRVPRVWSPRPPLSITVSNPPPVTSDLAVTPSVIWAPNHNMVDAMLIYNITDNCDAGIVPKIAITSNESANGAGDGNTSTDWQVIDAHHVQVRAERSGTGTGRVYTITLTATDSARSSTSSATVVTVPHNQ